MTETWTRDLLERAGETVPVGPPPTLQQPRPPRHRWPILAAAATVLVAVGAAILVGQLGPEPPRTTPAVNKSLSFNDLPLVFGMREAQAIHTVRAAGFRVTVRRELTCQEVPDRVISLTTPTAGRALLTVAGGAPAVADCSTNLAARAIAWQIIDLATHRGPGPDLAPDADCCSTTLLRRIDDAATHFAPTDGAFNASPQLFVEEPAVRGGPTIINMAIGLRVNGRVWPSAHVQVLVGNGLFGPAGKVLSLQKGSLPFTQEKARPGDNGESASDPDGVGRRFLDFALGRVGSLPVDTPVRLYLGNRYLKTLEGPAVTDRSAWRLCATYGEGSCPFSAVQTLGSNGGHPLAWSNDPHSGNFCPDSLEPGPPTDTGGSYAVVLSIPEPQSCTQAFEVQVWVNDSAQIVAVNLLLGSP